MIEIKINEPGGDIPARVLWCGHNLRVPNHNATEAASGFVYNDSNRHAVRVLRKGVLETEISIPGGSPFVRGLVLVSGTRALVGSQNPASIFDVDLESGEIVRSVRLSDRENESVYGICRLPDTFDDVPRTLDA